MTGGIERDLEEHKLRTGELPVEVVKARIQAAGPSLIEQVAALTEEVSTLLEQDAFKGEKDAYDRWIKISQNDRFALVEKYLGREHAASIIASLI